MQFHRCPMLWLNNAYSVMYWYGEYRACKEGLCGKPEYGKRQARWYDAERIYSNAIANIQSLSAEQEKSKKTTDGLKALKFGVSKRKKQNAG
jgi:hypothetical protein